MACSFGSSRTAACSYRPGGPLSRGAQAERTNPRLAFCRLDSDELCSRAASRGRIIARESRNRSHRHVTRLSPHILEEADAQQATFWSHRPLCKHFVCKHSRGPGGSERKVRVYERPGKFCVRFCLVF